MLKPWGNITKIALITFFSALYFYLPVLTIYYQQRGLNFIQINSLWGIITGTIFLAEIPTGVIADRIGRKLSIIMALALQLVGEVFFLFAQNYSHFVFISIIAGLGFAFQSGCLQALVYDSLKESNREDKAKKSFGAIGAFFQSAHILGALVSSFIIAQITPSRLALAIILTIISVGIALFISFFLNEPRLDYKHPEKSPLKIVSESFILIRRNPALKRIILLGLFTTPFIGYLRNFQPPYFQLSHIPSMWLGLSLAIGGAIAALASKYAHKVEKLFGVGRGLLLATVLPGLFYVFMGAVFHPTLAVLLFTLNFGSMSLQDPILTDYYNIHISSEIRATVLSTIGMFSSIYITLMGLLIGWVADTSLASAFIFMGGVVLLGAVLFRINATHIKPTIA